MNWFPVSILPLFIFAILLSGCSCHHQKEPVTEEQYQATKKQMIEVNRILIKKDEQRIKGYIERQGLKMYKTETGLWYSIIQEGKGPRIEAGRVVRLAFSLSLLEGTECYNSKIVGNKEFLVGKGGVEAGLEEGVLMLREGSKAEFIMPPHLAYGLPGDGDCIPARAIIHYKVEVLSIK
jgi:FKBP-type peptidyl-prolyl cis-trans isomerase FkpA